MRKFSFSILLLGFAALGFFGWVESRYAFTHDAVRRFGFVLIAEEESGDGWTGRTFVSSKPMREVEAALVSEMSGMGYDATLISSDDRLSIHFQRAGWAKATLDTDPLDSNKTRFHILETDGFIRRVLIVLNIGTC